MPFEIITHTKLKKDGTPISAGSVKIYKKLLNRLAEAGFSTKTQLEQNPEEVLALIEAVVDGDEDKHRAEKRQYLSAIFYALDGIPLTRKQIYYNAFQMNKQNYKKD
jgi:hypothetical protein